MSGRQIDYSSTTKQPARAMRHFPGLVEFLPRQAAGLAHRAGDPVEQGFTREAVEIVKCQPSTRGV